MIPNSQGGSAAYYQHAPAAYVAHIPGYQGQGLIHQSRNGHAGVGHRVVREGSTGSQHPYRNMRSQTHEPTSVRPVPTQRAQWRDKRDTPSMQQVKNTGAHSERPEHGNSQADEPKGTDESRIAQPNQKKPDDDQVRPTSIQQTTEREGTHEGQCLFTQRKRTDNTSSIGSGIPRTHGEREHVINLDDSDNCNDDGGSRDLPFLGGGRASERTWKRQSL